MAASKFQAAIERWSEPGLAESITEKLERLILDHQPQSVSEAVSMLDVAIPDLHIGGRSDGRDLQAVVAVRDLLAGTREIS